MGGVLGTPTFGHWEVESFVTSIGVFTLGVKLRSLRICLGFHWLYCLGTFQAPFALRTGEDQFRDGTDEKAPDIDGEMGRKIHVWAGVMNQEST